MDSKQLSEFISDKDIYVSSSSYDTFSIAAAECMSSGLAPIITNTTGISKLIINGENGFIIQHGDINDLSKNLNLLLNDKPLREKISHSASKIYDALKWSEIYRQYEIIYQKI